MSKAAAEASLWMTGWTTGECFLEYLEDFVVHVKFSQANKVLLLVKNHCSHIIAGINYCRENGIIMIGSCIMSRERFEMIPSFLH